jgi:hypothetical protein
MSSRRRNIIGVQAAAVALLVLLVYVTLLRPDSSDKLRPIEAPGGGQEAQSRPDSKPNGEDGSDGGGDDRPAGPSGPAGSGTGGGAPAPTVLAGTGGADGTGGTDTTGPGGTLPTDDQYTDSVGSLLRKVATGGPIGE